MLSLKFLFLFPRFKVPPISLVGWATPEIRRIGVVVKLARANQFRVVLLLASDGNVCLELVEQAEEILAFVCAGAVRAVENANGQIMKCVLEIRGVALDNALSRDVVGRVKPNGFGEQRIGSPELGWQRRAG